MIDGDFFQAPQGVPLDGDPPRPPLNSKYPSVLSSTTSAPKVYISSDASSRMI